MQEMAIRLEVEEERGRQRRDMASKSPGRADRLAKARHALGAIEGVLREELGQEDAPMVASNDDAAAAERRRARRAAEAWPDGHAKQQSHSTGKGLEFVPDLPHVDSVAPRYARGGGVASRARRGMRAEAGAGVVQPRASRIARAVRDVGGFVRGSLSEQGCGERPMDPGLRASGQPRTIVSLDGSACDEALGGGLRRGAAHCVAGMLLDGGDGDPQRMHSTWIPPVGALLHMVRRAVAQPPADALQSGRPTAVLWIGRSIWPDSRSFFGESDELSELVHRRSIFVCGDGGGCARHGRSEAPRRFGGKARTHGGNPCRAARTARTAWAAEQAIRLAAADVIVVDGRSFDDLMWRRLHLAAAEAEHEPLVLVAVPADPGMWSGREPDEASGRGRLRATAGVRCPAATRWLVTPRAPHADDGAWASSRVERASLHGQAMPTHPGWNLRLVSVRRVAGAGSSPSVAARIEAGEIGLSCGVLHGLEPRFPSDVDFGAAAPQHDGPGSDADGELLRLLARLDAAEAQRPDGQMRRERSGSTDGVRQDLQQDLRNASNSWQRWFAWSA